MNTTITPELAAAAQLLAVAGVTADQYQQLADQHAARTRDARTLTAAGQRLDGIADNHELASIRQPVVRAIADLLCTAGRYAAGEPVDRLSLDRELAVAQAILSPQDGAW